MNHTFLFVVTLLSVLSAPLSARRVVEAPPVPTVDPEVRQLAGKYRDVETLVEKARRDAQQVQRKAVREVESLKNKVRRGQSRLERRRQEALRREAEQRAVLEQKARAQEEEVRKQAEQKAAEMIKQAEKRARVLHDQLQMQEAQDRKNARPKITSEWRTEVISEFEKDTDFMRKVIMEGEASRIERQNFMILFDQQMQWFKTTVDKAEFFFDANYTAVMGKKNSMTALVDAQRQADEVVYDLVEQHHLSPNVRSQLRLLAMYEINNHLQNNKSDELFLSADTIHSLVEKISNEVAPGQREIKIVTEKERINTLEQRIAELEMQLAQEPVPVAPESTPTPVVDKDAELKKMEAAQSDKMASLEKEKEDEVSKIKKEADEKIAALTHEKNKAAVKVGRQTEREIARIQDRIDALEKEKVEAIAVAQKAAVVRVENLKAEHKRMVATLQEQQADAMSKVRTELAGLKKQRAAAQKRVVDQETELTAARAKAKKLSEKLSSARGKVTALSSEVEKLREQRKLREQVQEKERADLVSRIEKKQREKVEQEVKLAQVKQQLEVLTRKSHERLVDLTEQVAERAQTQDDLEEQLSKKARERAELEVAIAAKQEQLRALAVESQIALSSMHEQLAFNEERCHSLHQQLTEKQRESVELEASVRALQEATQHAVGRAHHMAGQRDSLKERVVHLQHALAALREQKKAGTEHPDLAQRALALAKQTQSEVSDLAQTIERQHHELRRRQSSFDQMQKLQGRLAHLRTKRGEDALRDAQQNEMAERVADFGQQVLNDYQTIARATHSAQDMHCHAQDLVEGLEDEQSGLPDKALDELDGVLTLLGETAHISENAPELPQPEETIGAPVRRSRVGEHEEAEEEEAPHEPDEHLEEPELVTEDGDEASEGADDVLDILAGEDAADDDAPEAPEDTDFDPFETETEPEGETEPVAEEIVAIAPSNQDDSSEEEDEDEGDEEDEQSARDQVLDVLSGNE